MGFGKKKTTGGTQVTQENVAMLASAALAKKHNTTIRLGVDVEFVDPVLMNRWTKKAMVQMLHKMVTGGALPREHKDLSADYEDSWYRNSARAVVIPCRLIKACIIEGAIGTGGSVSKAELKRGLRVEGHTAPITMNGKLDMDVRITGGNTIDVRARALVPAGSTMSFVLGFGPDLSPDKVIAATQAAGAQIGLCDWRQEKGGEFGGFKVVDCFGDAKRIATVLKACALREEEIALPPELLRAFNSIPDEKLSDPARKVKAVLHQNGAHAS